MTHRIVFAVLQDFAHLAFANAVEPLRIANMVTGRPLYRWSFVWADGQSAKASNGSLTQADASFGTLPKCDALFMVSGNNVRSHVCPATLH